MSTTVAITPTNVDGVVQLGGAPDGIVRLWAPSGVDVSKTDLRNAAAKIAHTVNVGRVPAGKPTKVNGVAGHAFDFAPVQRTSAKADATPEQAEDPRLAMLRGMGLTDEQIAAVFASPTLSTSAKVATGKGKGKGSTFVRDVIAPRAAAKAAAAKACQTCLGFGRVRKTPRTRKDGSVVTSFPLAFRTQRGADSAVSFETCPACKGKAHKTA